MRENASQSGRGTLSDEMRGRKVKERSRGGKTEQVGGC